MARFKTPTFEERTAAAHEAKRRALEKLRNKAAPDVEAAAARSAARQVREAVDAEKRAAHRATIEQEKAVREGIRSEAAAAAEQAAQARRPAPPPPLPTADDMKSARDARYAARKSRGRG